MPDKMTVEQIDLRKHRGEPELKGEEIGKRRGHLIGLDFPADWVDSLVEVRPTLFAPEFVNNHITGLTELGFTNPNKMIESFPAILSYSLEENIKPRVQLLNRLITVYQLPFSATSLVEQDPFLFSSKIDKILVLVRILREYKVRPPAPNTNIMRSLLHLNLESVLVALNEPPKEHETIEDFIKRARSVHRQKLPKEQKRQIIEQGLSEFEKIKSRYLKGYPKK
jgi:hypothetical protein